MSDETFFREVNEEIRQQRVHDLWRRFGRWLIAGAVLAVLLAVAYVVWREYRSNAANAAGDRFIAAVDLADEGKAEAALPELDALRAKSFGVYPQLAELRAAAIRQSQGDAKAALEGFDKVANDTNAPGPLRDIAAIRAGYVLVDTGSLDDVRARVERLSTDDAPLRFPAREALGLAAWKAGKLDEARGFFSKNRDDAQTPSGIALRSRVMMDLVEAGTTPESAAAAAAAAPAPAEPLPLPDTPIPLDLGSPADAAPPAPEASAPADAAPTASEPAASPQAEPAPAAPDAQTPAAEAPSAPDLASPPSAAPSEVAPSAPATATPAPAAPEPSAAPSPAPSPAPAAPAPSN